MTMAAVARHVVSRDRGIYVRRKSRYPIGRKLLLINDKLIGHHFWPDMGYLRLL
jgi:hypothetical protein